MGYVHLKIRFLKKGGGSEVGLHHEYEGSVP